MGGADIQVTGTAPGRAVPCTDPGDDVDVGVGTALAVGGAGIGSVVVLDSIIDATAHNHNSLAYSLAMKPSFTAFKYLAIGGAVLAGAGLLAKLHPSTKEHSSTLLKVGAGIGVGLLATVAFRLGWGMTVAPAQKGWLPGMAAKPHLRVNDLAANAVDRVHMMGRDPALTGKNWRIWDKVSQLQGHGPLLERTDLVPVLRYPNRTYRTALQAGTHLFDPTTQRTAAEIAAAAAAAAA